MDKKISYIVLGIIIVLVIGFIFFLQTQKPTEIPPVEKPPVEEVPQASEEIDIIVREAIDTQNPAVCEKIKEENTKKWCQKNAIIAEASLKRDVSLCEKLAEESEKLECQDNVIITQALDAKDPSLCQKLNDKTRIEGCREYISSLK